ncbi:MAG: hypothetical protein QOD12_2455 [Verrucomicrobiota bacterium]|jgi:hypothetical protein
MMQANGDWEHAYGVKIESLDNPGWSVLIDLVKTPLCSKSFVEIRTEESETDWITCRVKDGKFEGFGDPRKLGKILDLFREWASS